MFNQQRRPFNVQTFKKTKEDIDLILPRGNEMIYPEEWRVIDESVIPNIDNIYTISTYGRIYNSKTNTCLPQNMFYYKDKYITISLRLKTGEHIYEQIHRLVMMTFNPCDNMKNLEVNHLDGVKYHNWLWNLEWSTHKENLEHASRTELFVRKGEARQNTSISEATVHRVCQLIAEGYKREDVVKMIGSDEGSIKSLYNNIRNGHCWRHISKQYDFSNAYDRHVFNDEDRIIISNIITQNPELTNTEVLEKFGIKKSDPRIANYRSAVSFIRKRL